MKKIFFSLIIIFTVAIPVFSTVISVNPVNVGTNGLYIQANTVNNPVMHFSITADSAGDTLTYLGVENYLNSWYIGAAEEPASIAPNSVKLWYMSVDSDVFSTSNAVFVSVLPSDFSQTGGAYNWWYQNLNLFVANGSGLWVTIDTPMSPNSASLEFTTEYIEFNSGMPIDITGLPSSPPVMLITQTTPANNLEVSVSGGTMQPYVSTSQDNIIPFSISLYNNSGPNSAPCSVNSITLTVKSYSPAGVTLVPSDILSSIKIQDKNMGTIYGNITRNQLPQTASAIQIPISLLNIPANTTITANVVISSTTITAQAGTNFVFSIDDGSWINAYDYYTLKKVPVKTAVFSPSGMPLYSNFSVLQKQAFALKVSSSASSMPSSINKGQKEVPLMKLYFTNPGDPLTASEEIYNLKLSVFDGAGTPVAPASVFERLVITDESGNITYGFKSAQSMETSGNIASFPLLNTIGVISGSAVTVSVKADISQSAFPSSFYISLNDSSSVTARDANSFASVSVQGIPGFPQNSKTAALSGSVNTLVKRVLPYNIYSGDISVKIFECEFSSPVAFGSGNSLAARGITLTVKDLYGNAIPASSIFSSVKLKAETAGNITETSSFVLSSGLIYAYFSSPIPLTDTSKTVFTVTADISESASGRFSVFVDSPGHFNIFQQNDPAREIYINLAEGTFPVNAGTSLINGKSDQMLVSSFPNPFAAGKSCVIAYNLPEDCKVTLGIYDATGSLIKELIKKQPRLKGGYEDTGWDGRDSRGRQVPAGTYLIKITAESGGKQKSIIKKCSIIK